MNARPPEAVVVKEDAGARAELENRSRMNVAVSPSALKRVDSSAVSKRDLRRALEQPRSLVRKTDAR